MNIQIQEATINIINRNRISSTEVSDVLNKTGLLPGIKPINPGQFIAGPVSYVFTYHESNYPLHEQIRDVPEDSLVFVDCFDCKERAALGHLVAKFLVLYRRVKGLVVNGYVRDVHRIRKDGFPVWALGGTPIGCFNAQVTASDAISREVEERKRRFDQGILVSDDSGCTLIPQNAINEELLKKLEFIELQEDIWYFCIDTLKWDTFRTVCLKDYLKDQSVLPEILRNRMNEFSL